MKGTKCRVKFIATTPQAVRKLFMCGNTANLGKWEPKAAKEMRRKDGYFELIKVFNIGETVDFKVLEKMAWERVELGYWYEDIANHTIVAQKGLVINMEIPNFKYE